MGDGRSELGEHENVWEKFGNKGDLRRAGFGGFFPLKKYFQQPIGVCSRSRFEQLEKPAPARRKNASTIFYPVANS